MVMLSPKDIAAARPLMRTIILVTGGLSALMIAGGIMAIALQSRSPTNFSWLGLTITTGDVGVALVALGAVSSVLVMRKAFQVITELAKIPR